MALMPSKHGSLPENMVKESNAYLNIACHCPKCVVEMIGRDVIDLCDVHASMIVSVTGCTCDCRVVVWAARCSGMFAVFATWLQSYELP